MVKLPRSRRGRPVLGALIDLDGLVGLTEEGQSKRLLEAHVLIREVVVPGFLVARQMGADCEGRIDRAREPRFVAEVVVGPGKRLPSEAPGLEATAPGDGLRR